MNPKRCRCKTYTYRRLSMTYVHFRNSCYKFRGNGTTNQVVDRSLYMKHCLYKCFRYTCIKARNVPHDYHMTFCRHSRFPYDTTRQGTHIILIVQGNTDVFLAHMSCEPTDGLSIKVIRVCTSCVTRVSLGWWWKCWTWELQSSHEKVILPCERQLNISSVGISFPCQYSPKRDELVESFDF